MGRKEPKFTQAAGICLRRVLREYKVLTSKGRGQSQVTEGHYEIKVTSSRITHLFWVVLHLDIDKDGHLALQHDVTWLLMEFRSGSDELMSFFA